MVYFTEEEAKGKYCPMSMNYEYGIRDCRGSKCMKWEPEIVFEPVQESPFALKRVVTGKGRCDI